MPDMQTSLDQAGSITKAMLDALDQIEQYAAACQVGPDGKPSGTAIYMHMPMGYPIDPKMFANAWTPGGGDSSASFSNEGTFVPATPAPAPTGATATNGQGPPGAVYPPPMPKPDQQLEASIQAAMFTSFLVDNMLEVTQKGIAAAWPERRVSIEYFTILEGIQPVQTGAPEQSVLDAVKAAQDLLYLKDDKGNFVGYTQLYAQYRKNRTAWEAAIGDQAAAFARAMADPVAGQVWPVQAEVYADKVTQALNDFNSMGRREVENAINTIATVGQNAVTALAAMARQLWGAYNIQLGGAISADIPWSYISPISWWDHTNESFGIQKITATSSAYEARGGAGSSSFANNWWNEQSSSTSGSVGLNFGLVSGSANASHQEASNAFAAHSGQSGWSNHADRSSSATITMEFFLATIERPWLLGDLFNIEGWYLVGQKKNSISDGTIVTQVGDHAKLLPMIPKAFLVVRNVAITANDWGDAGNAFNSAQQDSGGSGQSSSNSYGGSVSYLGWGGSAQHDDQQASGAFGASGSSNSGWSFSSSGAGGTLSLLGSQIVGWIGEIQPAAPRIDAPPVKEPDSKSADTKTSDAKTDGGAAKTATPAP
ncbi:MAG: hypothetical protein H0X27_01285 [Caulobacteraceae bacterium]|nr:hypothetical protein [Caulobacteraceae bacterium]